METRRRIAVIGDAAERPQQRACLAALAEVLHGGAAARGLASEIVLAVTAGSEEAGEYEATGLAVRGFHWELLDAEAAERAMYYAGLRPLRAVGAPSTTVPSRLFAVPDDGIRHLCDCDAWVLTHPTAPAALLPLRPFLVMVDDTLHHASGGLSEETLRVAADNLTAASGVLVWSEEMLHEVVDFYGVERHRVRQLPRLPACGCRPLPLGSSGFDHHSEPPPEQGRVWFVTEASVGATVSEPAVSAVLSRAEPVATDERTMAAYGEALADLL